MDARSMNDSVQSRKNLQFHNFSVMNEHVPEMFAEDLEQQEESGSNNYLVLAFFALLVILSASLFFL